MSIQHDWQVSQAGCGSNPWLPKQEANPFCYKIAPEETQLAHIPFDLTRPGRVKWNELAEFSLEYFFQSVCVTVHLRSLFVVVSGIVEHELKVCDKCLVTCVLYEQNIKTTSESGVSLSRFQNDFKPNIWQQLLIVISNRFQTEYLVITSYYDFKPTILQ